VNAALPEGCDAVFNFAAESHVDRSIHSADEFLRTNIIGTQVLLDAARKKSVKAFLAGFDRRSDGSLPDESDDYFTEDSPLQPNSPYAASKAGAEFCVRAGPGNTRPGRRRHTLRNNYGPRQFPEKLIPLMIANAMNGEPLPVYGDGMNVRDWIYVDDHCRGIWLAYDAGDPARFTTSALEMSSTTSMSYVRCSTLWISPTT
jgi:dTDP-glucose 4,6-dehydratase